MKYTVISLVSFDMRVVESLTEEIMQELSLGRLAIVDMSTGRDLVLEETSPS
jgi:hypothetical protein